MAGWSTDFTWTVAGLTNVPTRSAVDIYLATKERANVSATSINGTTANAKLNRPRDYAYFADAAMEGMFGKYYDISQGAPETLGEDPTIVWLTKARLEEIIGFSKPEPMHYNAPITAVWMAWMYEALNLMTLVGLSAFSNDSEQRWANESTEAAYIIAYDATSWPPELSIGGKYKAESETYTLGRREGLRNRPYEMGTTFQGSPDSAMLYMRWVFINGDGSDTLDWDTEGFTIVDGEYLEMDTVSSPAPGPYTWPDLGPEDAPIAVDVPEHVELETDEKFVLADYEPTFTYSSL